MLLQPAQKACFDYLLYFSNPISICATFLTADFMTAIYERTDKAIRGLGLSQSRPVFIGIHMLLLYLTC